MGKASAPPAPDYTGAAQATAQGNLQNLQYQTQANRPNVQTPWGNETWSQGTNADGSGNNNWTQSISLSPDQQAALNAQQKVQMNDSQLAQTMQGQVASTMANGFSAPQMSAYMSGVPNVNSQFASFIPNRIGGVNQSSFDPSSYTGGAEGVSQNFSSSAQPQNQNFSSSAGNVDMNAGNSVASAGQTNLGAPQFSSADAQAGAQAAYKSSAGLLQDQWAQDSKNLDSQLRLQGLTPGSEAYNNAAQNLQRTQAQQQDQLANEAVVTGSNIANQNYASALAGYNSGNAAQQQAYNQGLGVFNANNAAVAQQYAQDYQTNAANNAASNTQFANDLSGYNASNAARSQYLQNALSQYGAALQGQSAYNTAQGQAYGQSLAGYSANQSAQQASNAAQQQSYQQALQNYQTAYQSAYQNYLQPLNSMNAVMTGQQVSMPSFPGFSQAGYTPGADYSGAATSLGQYDSAATAAQNASTSSTYGTLGAVASAALIAF